MKRREPKEIKETSCAKCLYSDLSPFSLPCKNCKKGSKYDPKAQKEIEESKSCEWLGLDDTGYYRTRCGKEASSREGLICKYCGKKIKITFLSDKPQSPISTSKESIRAEVVECDNVAIILNGKICGYLFAKEGCSFTKQEATEICRRINNK